MKSILILVAALFFVACNKSQMGLPASSANILAGSKVIGKWNIISVTTIAIDSASKATIATNVYPSQAGDYFQFNNDGTWAENLSGSTTSFLGESGTYTLNSDTTFTLVHIGNNISIPVPCTISSILSNSFVFSHQSSTAFNGTTPGYIKYVFNLTR